MKEFLEVYTSSIAGLFVLFGAFSVIVLSLVVSDTGQQLIKNLKSRSKAVFKNCMCGCFGKCQEAKPQKVTIKKPIRAIVEQPSFTIKPEAVKHEIAKPKEQLDPVKEYMKAAKVIELPEKLEEVEKFKKGWINYV